MEITKDTIEINNITYIIIEKMDINNNTYYFLSNENDKTDFFVQKLSEDKKELISLDSEEELNNVLSIFSKKYQ